MSQFDDRKKAAENKFSIDKELEFKATARRNKLLGQWAAGLMGMEGEAIDAYAAVHRVRTLPAPARPWFRQFLLPWSRGVQSG